MHNIFLAARLRIVFAAAAANDNWESGTTDKLEEKISAIRPNRGREFMNKYTIFTQTVGTIIKNIDRQSHPAVNALTANYLCTLTEAQTKTVKDYYKEISNKKQKYKFPLCQLTYLTYFSMHSNFHAFKFDLFFT